MATLLVQAYKLWGSALKKSAPDDHTEEGNVMSCSRASYGTSSPMPVAKTPKTCASSLTRSLNLGNRVVFSDQMPPNCATCRLFTAWRLPRFMTMCLTSEQPWWRRQWSPPRRCWATGNPYSSRSRTWPPADQPLAAHVTLYRASL